MKKELILFYSGNILNSGLNIVLESSKIKKVFPIKLIDSIYCFSEINFNSNLFNFLGNKNIPIYFFNFYGQIRGMFLPYNINNSSVTDCFKLLQVKIYFDFNIRIKIAKEFLISGLSNMIYLINLKKKNLDKINNLDIFKEKLNECKDINKLMLVEAKMRKIYYKHLGNLIKNNEFYFNGRNFNPPLDPFNALISFGNSLLYSFILTEMFKTNIDPKISFLHSPQDRRFSLTFDFSEIFKPIIVDRFILKIVNKKIIKTELHFKNLKNKSCYLNKEGKKLFIKYFLEFLDETINHTKLNRRVSYKYLIKLEVLKLIKSIKNEKEYISFKFKDGF